MAILTAPDREAIRQRLDEALAGEVSVTLFTEASGGLYVPGQRACETCADTEMLLGEVAELDQRILLEKVDVGSNPARAAAQDVTMTPTIVVAPPGEEGRARFVGLPAGYEFGSLLETIVSAASSDGRGLRQESLERLAELESDLEIKTFVTPT